MITPAYGLTATERVLPSFTLDWTTGLVQSTVDVTRAGVATFVGSNGLIQSAAANTQRIDYSTGTPALLVEEQRTNLATNSEVMSSGQRVTIESNVAIAPDGEQTMDRVVETTATGEHYPQNYAFTPTLNANYMWSCYAKLSETGQVRELVLRVAAGNGKQADFNLETGTAGGDGIIEDVGNGIFRCSLPWTATSTASTVCITQLRFAGTISYAGDGVSGLYIWGRQLEPGAFTTSYIKTEASAVTRNADVATVTGTNFSDFFNDAAGTFFIESDARSGDTLLTAGTYTLAADATALKKYATTYGADPVATELAIGDGLHRKVMYYPQELIAAELAALTA